MRRVIFKVCKAKDSTEKHTMVPRSLSLTCYIYTTFSDKHSDFSFQMFLFAVIKSAMVVFLVEALTSQAL